MHGVGRLHRVVDAEVMLRFTSAGIRVLLDNDVAALVPGLRSNPDLLEEALRNKKNTELRAVAQLIRTARELEREEDIRVLDIQAPDMFFMLDEGVVTEIYGRYPGHADAETAWAQMRSETGQNINRKRFRKEQYQVPDDLDTYRQISALMHARDLIPRALQDVLGHLEEWGG